MKTQYARAIDRRAYIHFIYLMTALFVMCMMLFAACAPNQAKPESIEDRVMAGYATVGAAYQTISDMAKRRAITKEQGQRMIARADDAKALLDNADALLSTGNQTTAEQSLTFAITILTALESEIKQKGTGT